MLSLNHEQQEPKVGTTSVSQMCKIRHSMTGGSQLFSFKTQAAQTLFVIYICDSIALRMNHLRERLKMVRKSLKIQLVVKHLNERSLP